MLVTILFAIICAIVIIFSKRFATWSVLLILKGVDEETKKESLRELNLKYRLLWAVYVLMVALMYLGTVGV